MTEETNVPVTEQQKPVENTTEVNFAKIRKKLEAESQEKEVLKARMIQLEKERDELLQKQSAPAEDDDDPYVDTKRLKREFSRYDQEFDKKVERRVQAALEEERKNGYLKRNPDFYSVLSSENLERLEKEEPELAESFLKLPDSFERQKLVYTFIKKNEESKKGKSDKSVQSSINENKKSPYYQPSNINPGPFAPVGDPKASYELMQRLIKNKKG